MPPSIDRSSSRLESTAFYALLVTVILAPLAFWPSQYLALEAVKTAVIAVGTILSAVCFLLIAFHEKKLTLPSKALAWSGALIVISIVASAIGSGRFMKSFFGQGFEIGSGSFLLLLIVAGLVSFWAVSRRAERVVVLYTGLVGSFLILAAIHGLRFLAGADFATLGIMNRITSTLVGNWYGFGVYAVLVAIIALCAVMLLPLSSKLRNAYWALAVVAGSFIFIINSPFVWRAAAVAFLALAIYMSVERARSAGVSVWKKIAWLPVVVFAIAAIFVYKGPDIAGPTINKLSAGYSEIALPWQMTMDVASGELKENPLLGSGPNRFAQAYLTYKPASVNTTDAWGVEFNSGFGLIPTFIVTQGLLGAVAWGLFLILFVVLGVRSLRGVMRGDPERSYMRFVMVSSYFSAAFLWLIAIIYVPPHAIFYTAFVMTGVWLGASVAYGKLQPALWVSPQIVGISSPPRKLSLVLMLLVVLTALWGGLFVKNTAALAYFGKGVRELTVDGNSVAADGHFRMALALNPIDVYWQGRVEAAIVRARSVVASASSATSTEATQKIAADAAALVNEAIKHAEQAIAADPSNYYNYVSAARVTEAATVLRMANSYDAGVQAYRSAIALNPGNPALYVSMGRFQAANNKFDEAIQTVGAGLQVKGNYLDAVFLLAQISAAKGNLPDAITASKFAVNLNPQNPLLHFQLGLFQYTSGDYASAAVTLAEAVKLQPDYANAQYFLGLSEARLGRVTNAIAQFEQLAASNPGNAEVNLILSNLRAGKSPFAGAEAPVSTAPEKRSTLPLQEKNR